MGGMGYILGGALQGLGNGISRQAEMDIQERREVARERLRTENRRAEIQQQGEVNRESAVREADLNDRNAGRQAARQAAYGEQRAGSDHRRDMEKVDRQAGNERALATLRGQIERGNTEAEVRLRNELDGGEIDDTFEGGDGYHWIIRKDGSRVSTGIPVRPRDVTTADDYGAPVKATAAAQPVREPGRAQSVGAGQDAGSGGTYTRAEYERGKARFLSANANRASRGEVSRADLIREFDQRLRERGLRPSY